MSLINALHYNEMLKHGFDPAYFREWTDDYMNFSHLEPEFQQWWSGVRFRFHPGFCHWLPARFMEPGEMWSNVPVEERKNFFHTRPKATIPPARRFMDGMAPPHMMPEVSMDPTYRMRFLEPRVREGEDYSQDYGHFDLAQHFQDRKRRIANGHAVTTMADMRRYMRHHYGY